MAAKAKRTSFVRLLVISFVVSRTFLEAGSHAWTKRQGVHAFLPLYRVHANDGRLAGEFDCRNDRIKLGGVEIALELLARIPIFDEQQGLASVEIRIQAGLQTAGRDSRWAEHGRKRAQ